MEIVRKFMNVIFSKELYDKIFLPTIAVIILGLLGNGYSSQMESAESSSNLKLQENSRKNV